MKRFEKKLWLATPTMHGEELTFMQEAYDTNWMSTVGANIDAVEALVKEKLGIGGAVALSAGTAALHLAVKLAGVRPGDLVLCSDMTFSATVNPIVYEGGVPVFIDAERETWNLDPEALEKAFALYPAAKAVMAAHLYGTPAKLGEIREICERHGAVLIEDAAESLGATYLGRQTGTFGYASGLSFNGNKVITGTAGGMLVTADPALAAKAKKWSTQSRENAAWYQHTEIGYNYRMSNVVAGVVRGQWGHLEEHLALKKAIYDRYKAGFAGLPCAMNPYEEGKSCPSFWLSCLLLDRDAMCPQTRTDLTASYVKQPGRTCPTEILEKLAAYNAEGRPIWKPMHMQPFYRDNPFVSAGSEDVGADIFARGLCLPSDIKMTPEEQDNVIEIVRSCFE